MVDMKSSVLRRAGTAAAAAVLVTSCGPGAGTTKEVGSLGSAEAVVACSERLFWGTVEATAHASDGLHVTFHVDDWVRPALGPPEVTLVADDPDENVGAPDWSTTERVLVREGRDSPLDMLQGEVAEEIVTAWEQADSPARCPESY